MQHVLTRQQLYDIIWERAVSKVAPELGISDVALRKRCKAHAIPLPDAVYWGKRNAGKTVARKPLPPMSAGTTDRIVILSRSADRQPKTVRMAIEAARTLVPAHVSTGRHKLVRATMAAARRTKPSHDWGAVTDLGAEHFRLRVHPDMLARAGQFLDLLVSGARSRGYGFRPGRDGLDVVVDDEAIPFSISHTIRRVRHQTTAAEKARVERYWSRREGLRWVTGDDFPETPSWDFKPADDLRLEINSWPRVDGVSRVYADTRTRRLEDRVDNILVSFVGYSASRRHQRTLDAERKLQAENAAHERAKLARLAVQEQDRVSWLADKLGDQSDLEALRQFVARLDYALIEKPGWAAMMVWIKDRLATAEARLEPAAIAVELERMEAFTSGATGQRPAPGP